MDFPLPSSWLALLLVLVPADLRVLETTLVAPSPSGPAPPESSLPLTFFDVFWLNSPPVQRLFFYRLSSSSSSSSSSVLSNLKASLSHAVRAFYPLAGRLRLTPGTPNRYELYYQPGDAVTFTVAEYHHVDVDDLATDDPREIAKIAPLVPPLPEGGAVLALQATVLHRGLALGVAVHHAACDGACSTHFLHTWAWAAACSGADAPPPPVIDRTLMSDPRGLYDVFCEAVPTADEMEHGKMSDDHLLATFTLSKEDMQRVKNVVAGEAARRGAVPPRCSSLVATLGFIWSCYQRAKDEAASSGDPTYLLLPVDHRSRMKPPLPDKYLGNCVGPALHAAPRDELAAGGAGGLFTACAAVAAAIEEAVGGIGSCGMDVWMERIREAGATGSMLSVAGSPRFRVYEADFGFGRPAKVDIVSVAKTGAMAVAESRSSGLGMEVGVSLPAGGMERFEKSFSDAIAWLAAPSTASSAVEVPL